MKRYAEPFKVSCPAELRWMVALVELTDGDGDGESDGDGDADGNELGEGDGLKCRPWEPTAEAGVARDAVTARVTIPTDRQTPAVRSHMVGVCDLRWVIGCRSEEFTPG